MTVFTRTTLVASVLVFAGSVHAQAPQAYSNQFTPRYVQQPNNVWNNAPYNQNNFNRSPWGNSMPIPWGNNNGGRNNFSMPWNNNGSNGFNMPWNNSGGNGSSMPTMPWGGNNGSNGFNMPWNNNGGSNNFYPNNGNNQNNGSNNGMPGGNFNGPWNNGSNAFPNVKGPWNNGWGSAPWSSERWKNDPMGSPSKWINFDDPKEGVAEMWEDAIKGPHRLGQMPGGWKAPSISVPNPVDVTDTFGKRWRGLPSEISEQADNFTYNIKK